MSGETSGSPEAAEPLELRGRPRPVRRFNRKALMLTGALGAVFIAATLAVALSPPHGIDDGAPKELYNTRHVAHADGLADLPASYADVVPTLGAPLPGDLGSAILRSERDAGLTPYMPAPSADPTPFRPSAELDAEREARLRAAQAEIGRAHV